MKTTRWLTLLLAAICCTSPVGAATIDTVPIGNPGNAGEVQPQGTFGAVGYNYRIGRTEVTNAQYVEFLNGVDPTGANTLALWNSFMSSKVGGGINFNGGAANGSKYEIKPGRDNNPVVYVSWYDSIRFANWMHNGQGGGDTETGAYTLLGGTPTPSNGPSVTRNAGAQWWLPSENEWYKAAYHKNDGATGNYWDYPTSTDAAPFSDQPPGSSAPTQSKTGNFYWYDSIANGYDDGYAVTGSPTLFISSQNYLTDVGAYTFSDSAYGTFDQGGNVWEWNEAVIPASFRGLRGGSFGGVTFDLLASNRGIVDLPPAYEDVIIGFRVARIPEPTTMLLGALGMVAVLWWKRV
jgi:formylglycine-generating enzyme